MVFIWRSNLEFIKKWLALCLIGEQRPRNHVGDTNTIVFTCDETVPDSPEERQTSKEILRVAWCSISEQGEEKRGLAVPIVGSRAGASACSCQLLLSGPVRKLIVLPSDYVCLPAIFLGNVVIITEWCMKILSLTSSQVTIMLQNREWR